MAGHEDNPNVGCVIMALTDRRTLRASTSDDEVASAVGGERRVAAVVKKSLESHLAEVDRMFHTLKTERELLLEAIKREEKEIHLAPLSYGLVLSLAL